MQFLEKEKNDMLKVIELFAGVGCQREALKRANIDFSKINEK